MESSDRRWHHGAYIHVRRLALGLSQPALARAARVSPAMIHRLESGQRRGRPPLLRAVADALQVPASELLERAGYTTEAGYWRAQEAGRESPEPLSQFANALSAVPMRPAVRTALLAVATELTRDYGQEFRERFDQAVARHPDEAEAFAALRALIFEPESTPPAERA